MSGIDYIKAAIVLPLFFVLGPLGGVALKNRPVAQRVVFAIVCFMTLNGLMGPGNWGLTLGSIETYRGHTKGYYFYFNQALAIALLVANRLDAPAGFRWIPPGLGLYLTYCGLSMLSLFSAFDVNLVLMSAHKMLLASVVMIAAFNLLRTEKDLRFFLQVMAGAMAWELFVCLKLKYLGGIYQVRGTFESQNALAMYAVLIGMVFFATHLGPAYRGAGRLFGGFLVCAAIVQCTLSRAALVIFAAGTIGVVGVSVVEKPTGRRLMTVAILGVLGAAGLALTLDTIVARFNDRGNAASAELREVMKTACREMVRDHPLGVGWNNYALVVNPPYAYADIYSEWIRGRGMKVDDTRANSVVESHYYLLLSENGYPGLISWIGLIVITLWRNLRAYWFFGHSFLRGLSLGIGAGCILNYVQSILERVLTQPRNLMLWLILLGITGRIEILRRQALHTGPAVSSPR